MLDISFQQKERKMDCFGFQNQGKNYGKFRPQYPESLYKQTLNCLSSKNNYLDIAMGTGQLLFNVASEFDFAKGIDISDNMLSAARSQLSDQFAYLNDKIQIQKCDVLNIPTSERYDLITVGQALHWLPIKQALEKMRSLLNPNGRLLIISYIVKGLQDQNQDQIYQKFYEQTKETKPAFCFDRDQLHKHYTDKEQYPFEEYFKNVNITSQLVKIPMPKSVYISYMKTYAGYNKLMAEKAFMSDPIKPVEENTRGDEVTVVMDYFKVQCWN